MTEQEILEKLTTILRDLLEDEDIVLTMDTTRPEVPRWDSFAYVNFIVAVEGEFGIRFQVSDVESFPDVGAVVKQVKILKS